MRLGGKSMHHRIRKHSFFQRGKKKKTGEKTIRDRGQLHQVNLRRPSWEFESKIHHMVFNTNNKSIQNMNTDTTTTNIKKTNQNPKANHRVEIRNPLNFEWWRVGWPNQFKAEGLGFGMENMRIVNYTLYFSFQGPVWIYGPCVVVPRGFSFGPNAKVSFFLLL